MTSYKLTGWLYLLGFKSLLSVLDRETHTHTLSILRYDISACSKKNRDMENQNFPYQMLIDDTK